MSHTLTLKSELIHLSRQTEKSPWRTPLVAALTIQLTLFLVGFISNKDSILDLIANGETLAITPTDLPQEKKEIEVDLVPPPPPEANPEFIRPQEVIKKIEQPPQVVKPKPTPIAQTPQPSTTSYASSLFQIGNQNCPKPAYPLEAKIKRYQGTVVVSMSILNGKVVEAEVASSSGYASLDEGAVSWIRSHWKFPDGVTTNRSVPIRFELAG